jgi:small subunit ribosomal protein S3
MGQKVNPKSFRLGITEECDSVWYDIKNYSSKVHEDYIVRNFLKTELSRAAISNIQIKRKSDNIEINVTSARTGVIFGKSGIDMELLTNDLKKLIKTNMVVINILENKKPDSSAHLLASWICGQIEKRVPFRRAMKMAMQKSLKSGINGVKVSCSGRLGGIEIARCEWYKEGKIPLHTLRAKVDYAFDEALTTYGKIGVKVWLYKGEQLKQSFSKIEGNKTNALSKKN